MQWLFTTTLPTTSGERLVFFLPTFQRAATSATLRLHMSYLSTRHIQCDSRLSVEKWARSSFSRVFQLVGVCRQNSPLLSVSRVTQCCNEVWQIDGAVHSETGGEEWRTKTARRGWGKRRGVDFEISLLGLVNFVAENWLNPSCKGKNGTISTWIITKHTTGQVKLREERSRKQTRGVVDFIGSNGAIFLPSVSLYVCPPAPKVRIGP